MYLGIQIIFRHVTNKKFEKRKNVVVFLFFLCRYKKNTRKIRKIRKIQKYFIKKVIVKKNYRENILSEKKLFFNGAL